MTTTLENLIHDVHQRSANHHDEIIPVKDMEFDSLSKVWVAGKPVDVMPSAQRLLSNRLRVPYTYLERCPEELQARNLNFWIEQEAKQRSTFFCRFDGQKIRAVFTERYKPLDNMEILSQLVENGFDSSAEVQYSIDESMFLVKIPEYSRTFNVSSAHEKQDRIVPGISLTNSEVGIMAFSIEAFFYRLVCTNGLITMTSSTSRFKHISSRGLENFNDVIAQAIQNSIHNQSMFQISRQSEVTNPIASIEMFSHQFGLTQIETEAVKTAYMNEQGSSMFYVINAFTAAAKSPGLTTGEIYKLEKTGGQILAMVKK